MSSISNIYSYNKLSSYTKLRLEALGIDPTSVSTESQAQHLIAQAEDARKQGTTLKHGGTTREQLTSEAKQLAQKVGARFSDRDSLEKILENISYKLNNMSKNHEDNEVIQIIQARLSDIAERAEETVKTQKNIFNEMEMISVSNKLILGL